MEQSRLRKLHKAGQSIWLDYIDRAMLQNGDLERRISEDALTGMTSNPTIFQKALAEGHAYDDQIRTLAAGLSASDLFERIATDDVRDACDAFADVYAETQGEDGYVSIEVAPELAHNAAGTVLEGHRLWATVNRPNVMIKVPGTEQGAVAIRQLIAEGINVNVTLLFSVDAHARVIEAYVSGLEDRLAAGKPIDTLASVASFFVSRVDTDIDKRLDGLAAGAANDADRETFQSLKGRAAIANAKLAYRLFQQQFSGDRWARLQAAGARVQRPLWASTSTKNPAYRDVMYVEELIGPHTVNTMPPATVEAFRDHGEVRRRVDADVDAAQADLAALAKAGISLDEVTDKLLTDGIKSFQQSFDQLLAELAGKVQALGLQPA